MATEEEEVNPNANKTYLEAQEYSRYLQDRVNQAKADRLAQAPSELGLNPQESSILDLVPGYLRGDDGNFNYFQNPNANKTWQAAQELGREIRFGPDVRSQASIDVDPQIAAAQQKLADERVRQWKEEAEGPFMGPWGSGQFKSGHGSSEGVNPEWQEPGFYLPEDNVRGRFDDLLDLYDQLHSSDSEAAKSYFDTIQAYIGDSGTRGANQIQSDTDVINRQLDDMWENSFGVDGREAKNDLRFEAEFQNAIQGMEDTQEAADARLGIWGIDPQRWTAGAGAETAALLTSQAMNGARFANEMGAIMKMAHGMANARVNQGMAAEARNLANTVSQLGLQAQLQYKSNIQQIDRELLMNKIGVEQASMALNAAEEAALDKSLAAMQAYQILGAMTNTSSKQWMAADQVGITDDLFARTPLIPSLPDTDRPLGATAIHPEGFEYPFPVSYKDIGELNQIIETYLQMDRNA